MCAYYCAQLSYATRHRTVTIFFLLFSRLSSERRWLWPPNRAGHYILPLWFLLLLFFRFLLAYSQRSQIGCLPYFHTWCGLSANLECRSEICCTRLAENTGRKNSPSAHHGTTLSVYIFTTKAYIDNRKHVKQQYLLHMSSQYGEIRPTNGWDRWRVWSTPANFNGFRVLASLLQRRRSTAQQHSTEGATYIRQGGHHVGHRPTFWLLLEGRGSLLSVYRFSLEWKVVTIRPLETRLRCCYECH